MTAFFLPCAAVLLQDTQMALWSIITAIRRNTLQVRPVTQLPPPNLFQLLFLTFPHPEQCGHWSGVRACVRACVRVCVHACLMFSLLVCI